MLLVRTTLAPSAIHGLGLFAAEPIAAGAALWRFEPDLDQVVPVARVAALPEAFRAFIVTYGYLSPAFPGSYVLSCDHAKFMNHADAPNTAIDGDVTRAARPIAAGEELTCDYRAFVDGWTGFA